LWATNPLKFYLLSFVFSVEMVNKNESSFPRFAFGRNNRLDYRCQLDVRQSSRLINSLDLEPIETCGGVPPGIPP